MTANKPLHSKSMAALDETEDEAEEEHEQSDQMRVGRAMSFSRELPCSRSRPMASKFSGASAAASFAVVEAAFLKYCGFF